MKKLVFMLATIAVAVGVQAASVDWGTEKGAFTMKEGGAAAGVTVYLISADSSGYASLLAGLADGTVNAGNIASQTAYVDSGVTGTGSKGSGKVSTRTVTGSYTAGQDYNFAFVVFDTVASGENAGDWYYVSGVQPGSAWDGSSYLQDLANPASWTSSSFNASNWTKVSSDVPEPTSGLLLVLGGAMLALRRRR